MRIKNILIVFSAILLAGIAFSVVQLTSASPAAPNPGHTWSQIGDFPINCTAGQYVYGLTSTALSCSTPAAGGVTGSGTANYVSKWTGSSSLGISQIQDNGGGVGIGKAPGLIPGQTTYYWPLDVLGAIHTTYDINADNRVRGAGLCIGGTVGTNEGCKTSWPVLSCGQYNSSYDMPSGTGAITYQTVSCPSGYFVTGGGCKCEQGATGGGPTFIGERYISQSTPNGQGWFCYCQNDDQNTWSLKVTVYAICCNLQ